MMMFLGLFMQPAAPDVAEAQVTAAGFIFYLLSLQTQSDKEQRSTEALWVNPAPDLGDSWCN